MNWILPLVLVCTGAFGCGDSTTQPPVAAAPTPTDYTWYIKADGTGDLPTIQAAIDVAEPGDVILVAAGRYTWENQGGGSPPHAMIHIARYREGFILRSQSGPEATIIDAQRQGRGFYIDGQNDTVIDGFTITGGLAPEFGDYNGGGMAAAHTSDIIKNCIFENNEARLGGGLFLGGNGTVRIENCVFRNNTATADGGGMWFAYSPFSFQIIDCQVYGNTALTGAGIFGIRAALTIENTVIVNNKATVQGGGIRGHTLFPSFIRGCTVSANEAPDGGAMCLTAGSPVAVERSIFGFNEGWNAIALSAGAVLTVGCCDFFGNRGGDALPAEATDGGDNIAADPAFCNSPASPDPILKGSSPCLPGNHPGGASCGVIGARSRTCEAASAVNSGWGDRLRPAGYH